MAGKQLSKKLLSPNVKAFMGPVGLLLLLVILSVFAFRFGFAKISEQRQNVSTARQNESVLSQKESILKDIQSGVPSYVKAVAAALPEKNPSLSMVSQIRILSSEKGLSLGNIKVGSEIAAGGASISEVDVTFGIEGPAAEIVSFLAAVKELAPVSTIEKAKINRSSIGTRADITLRVYKSEFPQKLPSLTEPARALTDDEKTTLTKLSALRLPIFTDLTPQGGGVRENPFE